MSGLQTQAGPAPPQAPAKTQRPGASAGPHSPRREPGGAWGPGRSQGARAEAWEADPEGPGHIPALRAPLALQPAGDVQGGTRGSAALLLPRTDKAPSEDRRDDCYRLPIAREDIHFLASWEELARHEDTLLQVCARPLGWLASGAAHHDLRGLQPHWHAQLGKPSPQRPPPLDCSARLAAPTSPSVCSQARWSVWTWSGDRLSAQAAGPGFRSCRWPWRAVCSCWTCPSSRILREGRHPAPSPSWCLGCSQIPPSPSWVSSTRPRPSPAGPGGLASPLAPVTAASPNCRLRDGGGPAEPGCVLPSPGAGRAAAAGRPGPATGAQTGQHWGCAGGSLLCGAAHTAAPGSGLTEDWFLPGPSPDPWPQVTRDPEYRVPQERVLPHIPTLPRASLAMPLPPGSSAHPWGLRCGPQS